MILGFFGVVYNTWIYNAWLPQYLEIEHHVSIARTGWIAAIPFFFGAAGSVVGGRICDLFLRRGHSPMASRKIPMVASLLGAALFTLLAGGAATTAAAIFYISTSLFLLYIASTSAWAMVTVATTQCTASLGSIQNCGGYVGGALAPIVTGLIAQKTGSFRLTLVVGAAVAVAAALFHLILVRDPLDVAKRASVSSE
jgi:MFS family permease